MLGRRYSLLILCAGLACSTARDGAAATGSTGLVETSGSTSAGPASSSGDAAESTSASRTSGTSSSSATSETSAGEVCLPSSVAEFFLTISLEPLPPNQIGGTFEGECEVSSATNLHLVLDCEDGVLLSVQQEANPPIDFLRVPSSLSVRAFYIDGTIGNPATEVVVRDANGTLMFAYSDRDLPWEELDPPWRSSLEPLTIAAGESDCEEELSFYCATCTSRSLLVNDGEVEEALLQGEQGSFGPWTLTVARLMDCEAICEGANPRMFSIGVVHDSVRR